MSTIQGIKLVRLNDGLISRHIFTDTQIYREELGKVFAKTWLFIGHEAQVPNKGDYVTNYMAEDPVIMCRGGDGKVRVFLNSCSHRGMKVCRTDSGNTSEFQCSFHGWSYANNGDLQGVPFIRECYKGNLNKRDWGLKQIPRVETHGGFVFACWDEEAVKLAHFLGDLRWYLDVILERHVGGLEFIPGQQRYKMAANWKMVAENFCGDNYHLHHSHSTIFELPIRPINPINPISYRKPLKYHNVFFANGHGLNGLTINSERYELDLQLAKEMGPDVVEYVEECHNRLEKLSKNQAKVHGLSFGNIFPNFSINDFSVLRPVGLYLFHPRGPGQLEAWHWGAVGADAPQSVKDMCRIDYPRTSAISGLAFQDDTENFEQVQEAVQGFMSRKLDLNYQMNRGNLTGEQIEGYPGHFAPYISELNQTNLYSYWSVLMGEPRAGE